MPTESRAFTPVVTAIVTLCFGLEKAAGGSCLAVRGIGPW